jgi:hydroxyacylglutathione hydrolase
MLLKYFYDSNLAQASYLVGDAATSASLVVDPARDITPYLHFAAQENLHIRYIAETHIHADFVSGGRELAAHTGAKLYLSRMGDADWQYTYTHEPYVVLVANGESWMVGNIRVEVTHTPGHTPEHITFTITDTAGANHPMGIFTGDFVFVGDVGRPDLLEAVAGVADSSEAGARQQFQSVQRIKLLPDYLQIWPGHGAGSVCGKALGAVPSTTLGYEKLFNPAFQFTQEDEFVEWLLADQPEPPRYFAQMKQVNKAGPELLANLTPPTRLTRRTVDDFIAAGDLVIDLRPAADYQRTYIPGTINIPATSDKFTTYVGWFVDYSRPLSLIVPDVAKLGDLLRSLRAIGVDQIAGYAGPDVVMGNTATLPVMNAQELAAHQAANDVLIVDVRGQDEYREEHIVGARNIPVGLLPEYLDELPHDQQVVVHCASGYRSQVASSLLHAKGFDNVVGLQASQDKWSTLLDTTKGD